MDETLTGILEQGTSQGLSPVELAGAVKAYRNDTAKGIDSTGEHPDVRLSALAQLDADAQEAMDATKTLEVRRHYDEYFADAPAERAFFHKAFEDAKYNPDQIILPEQKGDYPPSKNWKGFAQGIRGVLENPDFDIPDSGHEAVRGGQIKNGDAPIAYFDTLHNGEKSKAVVRFPGDDKNPANYEEAIRFLKAEIAKPHPAFKGAGEVAAAQKELHRLETEVKGMGQKPLEVDIPSFTQNDVTTRLEDNRRKMNEAAENAQKQLADVDFFSNSVSLGLESPDVSKSQINNQAKKEIDALKSENLSLQKDGVKFLQGEAVQKEILKPENRGRIADKGLLQDVERGAVKLAINTGTAYLAAKQALTPGSPPLSEPSAELKQSIEAGNAAEEVLPGAVPRHMEGGIKNDILTGAAESLPLTMALLGTSGASSLVTEAGAVAPLLGMYAPSYGAKYGQQITQAEGLEQQAAAAEQAGDTEAAGEFYTQAKDLRRLANVAAHVSAGIETATEMMNPAHAPFRKGVMGGIKHTIGSMIEEGPVEEVTASVLQNAVEPVTSGGVNNPPLFEGAATAAGAGALAALPFGAAQILQDDTGRARRVVEEYQRARDTLDPNSPELERYRQAAQDAHEFLNQGTPETRIATLEERVAEAAAHAAAMNNPAANLVSETAAAIVDSGAPDVGLTVEALEQKAGALATDAAVEEAANQNFGLLVTPEAKEAAQKYGIAVTPETTTEEIETQVASIEAAKEQSAKFAAEKAAKTPASSSGIAVTPESTPGDIATQQQNIDAAKAQSAKFAAEKAAKASAVAPALAPTPLLEPSTAHEEFTRRADEADKAGDKPRAETLRKAGAVLAPLLQKWGKAFSGVRIETGVGTTAAVEGETLVIDPDYIADQLAEGVITPESIESVVLEEVLHPTVDRATARMLASELGIPVERVTPEQVRDQHAKDWQALPKRVQQESERLYRAAVIHRAREAKGSDLTEAEIDEAVAKVGASDITRGAEFKRQVMQGRIFGILTEEAQKRPDFAEWLTKFLNELIASIKNIAAKLTDPVAIKKLDELEKGVREELAKIGVTGIEAARTEIEALPQTVTEQELIDGSAPALMSWASKTAARVKDFSEFVKVGVAELGKEFARFADRLWRAVQVAIIATIGFQGTSTHETSASPSKPQILSGPIQALLSEPATRGGISLNPSIAPVVDSLPLRGIAVFDTQIDLGASTEIPASNLRDLPQPQAKKADLGGVSVSAQTRKLADWIVGRNDHKNSPFVVADKRAGTLCIFDANGKLVKMAPALFGKEKGDVFTGKHSRVTPSGRFAVNDTDVGPYAAGEEERAANMGRAIDVTQHSDPEYMVAIHRLYLGNPSEERPVRLATRDPSDNRISYGCINLDEKVMDETLLPLFNEGGVVYVLPETKEGEGAFSGFSESTRFAPEPIPSAQEENKRELAGIMEQFQRQTQTSQTEGTEPDQPTEEGRTYKSDNTRASSYRVPFTRAQMFAMADRALRLSAQLSGGINAEFSKKVLDYISPNGGELEGIPDDPILKTLISSMLVNNTHGLASELKIDPNDAKKPLSQHLTRLATGLGFVANEIWNPMEALGNEGRKETEEKMKGQGIDSPQGLADDIKTELETKQREIAAEITPEIKREIVEQVSDDSLFEGAMDVLDEARGKILTKIKATLVHIRTLRAKIAAKLGSTAKSAPEPVGGEASQTVEELQAELDAAVAELNDLLDEFNDRPKKKKKAADVESEASEAVEQLSFTEWVEGKSQEGIKDFGDLVLANINANGFNRDAFAQSLADKFEKVDPDFIQGVTERIADLLDGREEEEGEAGSAPDYDGRAKDIVARAVAQDSMPAPDAKQADPLTALMKKRIKGEITAAQFTEGAKKLGIEEQSALALNRKVERDIQRAERRKALAKAKADAKKDASTRKREAEKSEREAKAQIDKLAKELSDARTEAGKKAPSELKKLTDDFIGFKITEEQLREGLAKLNVKPATADSLAAILLENRRRQILENYVTLQQKAAKAHQDAVDSALKKLKNPKVPNLQKSNKFVKFLLYALKSGILNSDTVRDAFTLAYDLHGLTTPRLEKLAKIVRDIEALPDGMVRQTLMDEALGIINDIAPNAKVMEFLYQNLMGHVLSGASTMLNQFSNVTGTINPLQAALKFILLTDKKALLNPINFFRVWGKFVKEIGMAAPLVGTGVQGIAGGKTFGLGVSPSRFTSVTPTHTNVGKYRYSELWKYRLGKMGLLRAIMGFEPTSRVGRIAKTAALTPAWFASRSFNLIRAAEALTGGVDKNMAFRQLAMAQLIASDGLTWKEAWNKVNDWLNPTTNKVEWDAAKAQATKEAGSKTVSSFAIRQRAEEIMQDKLDADHKLRVGNRHREISALNNFKSDPTTWAGSQLAKVAKWPLPWRAVFLFSRFFASNFERAWAHSPFGFTHRIRANRGEATSEVEKHIEAVYGSMENYHRFRDAEAMVGVVHTFMLSAMMALSWALWKWLDDGDKDKAPPFWITGGTPPASEFTKGRQLEAQGWWKPNTLYMRIPGTDASLQINYVQSNPNLAITLSAIGNMADHIMFSNMLNYKIDDRTGDRLFDPKKAIVVPMLYAMLSPATRSTYVTTQQAISRSIEQGDPTQLIKLLSRPVGGALGGTLIGGPVVKDVEKLTRDDTPRSPKTMEQIISSGIPFAQQMGLSTGLPMVNAMGEGITPYPMFSFLSRSQQSSEEVKKASALLNDIGILKEGVQEWMLDDNTVEVAIDGKRVLLDLDEREQVLSQIGKEFANGLNAKADKIRAMDFDKAKQEVQRIQGNAREKVLRGWREKIKK